MTPNALSLTFLFYALAVTGVVALWLRRTLPEPQAKLALSLICAWLAYAAIPASTGFLERGGNDQPRFLVVIVPMLLFIAWLSLSPKVGAWAKTQRVDLLMGAQRFRLGVEVLLYFMCLEHIVPKVMTFEGRNFDVFIALTAPVAAWAYRRLPKGRRAIRIGWNIAGLLMLLNVVGHGVLSAPGPQRQVFDDTPNRAIILFPYIYIGAVFVLLAVSLHVLALRAGDRQGT